MALALDQILEITYPVPYKNVQLSNFKKVNLMQFSCQRDFLMFLVSVGYATKRFPVNTAEIKLNILKVKLQKLAEKQSIPLGYLLFKGIFRTTNELYEEHIQ